MTDQEQEPRNPRSITLGINREGSLTLHSGWIMNKADRRTAQDFIVVSYFGGVHTPEPVFVVEQAADDCERVRITFARDYGPHSAYEVIRYLYGHTAYDALQTKLREKGALKDLPYEYRLSADEAATFQERARELAGEFHNGVGTKLQAEFSFMQNLDTREWYYGTEPTDGRRQLGDDAQGLVQSLEPISAPPGT